MKSNLYRRKIASNIVVAFIVGVTLGAILWNVTILPAQAFLDRFSSYEELKDFLSAAPEIPPYYKEGDVILNSGSRSYGSIPVESVPPSPAVPEYSTTNIQVVGVDEADMVKTDGQYIYVVSENRIVILKAYPPEEARVLSQISLNGTLWGIFINGDKLAVLHDEFGYYSSYDVFIPYETPRTFIKVYDVSDRESPVLERDFSLSGYYLNSRMIGNYVYAVIGQPAYLDENEVVLPKVYSGNIVKEVDATEIYYSNVSDRDRYYVYTTIVAVNLQSDLQEPTYETILVGAASCMYVSLDNIYVTFWKAEKTLIYRIQIRQEEIRCKASGEVLGHLLNQFSMDEYQDHFRVATTTGHVARSLNQATSQNHVYVLDTDLNIVGSLEALAPGEKIYSSRFMGERCYLVTFKKVDPLFVIDLQNPYNPKVLGFLKVTGYSDYLHPYDENHIIGIGKETEEANEGDFAWYQGVKISLFDVSNVSNPLEIAKYEIGDRGTDSPVLRDHKAFLFDRSRNLLVFPVMVAEIDETKYPGEVPPNAHGDPVWQGTYVFDISLEEGFVLKGGVTHLEDDTDLWASNCWVKRSLYINNALYTISDKKIKINSLENLAEINEVEFP